jgi:ABC-2 type transport system ATP-binding protein
MPELTVEAIGLVKTFRSGAATVRALDGLDLAVPRGTVHGVLGPNGAGKTTAVRALATLSTLDSGEARVAGIDVRRQPERVRGRIGLAGQHAAVDEKLTGRENLRMFGRLYHLGEARARARADELLAQFELEDAGSRLVRTYSGGMRRRLDLAASLLVAPEVLFLDEPTTGLDPRARREVWESVRGLVADGTTVLLTTQYLDEADQLADQISVVDRGRVIASGTSTELKQQVGGDRLDVIVSDPASTAAATAALVRATGATPRIDELGTRISVAAPGGVAVLAAAVRELDRAGIGTEDLSLRQPTLDDVFLQLTGQPAEEEVA